MRKIALLLAAAALAVPALAVGPKFSTSGGVGSSASTFQDGEPTGGTYTINGTTGRVSAPIINLRPGSAPTTPQNGDCWTTIAGLFCRINGVNIGPFQSSEGAGTVTQVGLVPPSIFTPGAPVTTTGNLSFSLNSQTGNQVFAGPNGSSGTPGFRALVGADIPAVDVGASGNGGVTGALAIANGGTGSTTAANARNALGLGTLAIQNAATVAITGGSISGITDLAVADGGTGASSASAARTNLGASTVGSNLFTLTNPSAVTFPRFNADNTVSTLDASTTRTALGLGTASIQNIGTSGTNIPLLDGINTWSAAQAMPSLSLTTALPVASGGTGATSATANQIFAAPNGSAGAPGFRALVAADIPTLNQNTTGTAANVTGTVALANGGTGATSASAARTALGLGTAATVNTGTSGAVIPLLSGGNTWGAGQIIGGYLTLSGTANDRSAIINTNAGQERSLIMQSAGSYRWSLGTSNAAEAGSNAGSDFYIARFSDAGSYLGQPLSIARSSGQVTFGGDTTQATKQFVGSINPSNVASNWIETLRPASTQIAQSVSVNAGGYIGHLAASRSGDNTCTGGCMGTIGYEAIVHNNNVTAGQVQYAYGAYIEAVRDAGAGTTHAAEFDVRNKGTLVAVTPNNMFSSGTTPGLWVASGAGYAETNNSAAIGIVANGTKWDKGIVFDVNGLATRADTLKEAITLGSAHTISWRDSAGNVGSNIYSDGSSSGGATTINLAFNNTTNAVFTKLGGTALFNVGQDRTIASTPLILANYTVAALPICSSDKKGAMAAATDLTAITYNGSPTGGGSLSAPVYCNGTSWTIH